MEARTVTTSVGVILLTLVGTGTSNHCFNSEGKKDDLCIYIAIFIYTYASMHDAQKQSWCYCVECMWVVICIIHSSQAIQYVNTENSVIAYLYRN